MIRYPENLDDYPGIQAAFGYIQNALVEQRQTMESLESKVMTLWAAATAVLGVGIPIIVDRIASLSLIDKTLVTSAGIAWLIATVAALVAIVPQPHHTMRHPGSLREHYWKLSPQRFTWAMLHHIEAAFKENGRRHKVKGVALVCVFGSVPSELILVVVLAAPTIL